MSVREEYKLDLSCIKEFSCVVELGKCQSAYNKLYKKHEIALKFIEQIVLTWDCDLNHATAVLNELKRDS